jgi:hypothetical protein
MDKIPEKRKYVRIEKPYLISFRIKPCDGMPTQGWDVIPIINLSAGGIFFYSKTDLEVGTILDLKIDFSLVHPSIICVGKVIRAKRHPDASKIGYSVEFSEIDEQFRKRINKTLEITK